jgi:hypothetical protein
MPPRHLSLLNKRQRLYSSIKLCCLFSFPFQSESPGLILFDSSMLKSDYSFLFCLLCVSHLAWPILCLPFVCQTLARSLPYSLFSHFSVCISGSLTSDSVLNTSYARGRAVLLSVCWCMTVNLYLYGYNSCSQYTVNLDGCACLYRRAL